MLRGVRVVVVLFSGGSPESGLYSLNSCWHLSVPLTCLFSITTDIPDCGWRVGHRLRLGRGFSPLDFDGGQELCGGQQSPPRLLIALPGFV